MDSRIKLYIRNYNLDIQLNYICNNLKKYFINNDKEFNIKVSDIIENIMFIISIPYRNNYIYLHLVIDYTKPNINKIFYILYTIINDSTIKYFENLGYKYYDYEWFEYNIKCDKSSIEPLLQHFIHVRNELSYSSLRINYINFREGCYAEEGNIAKYLFNDLILREICSYL
jgi:hypothetical protein